MMVMTSGASARFRFFGVLFLLVILPCLALSEENPPREKNFREKISSWFKKENKKEESLPPVEEVFAEAESFYQGRETWYGKLVRKTFGEESKAYRKLPGVQRKNYSRALELYQQVMDNYPFSRYAIKAELRIADCHFQMDEFKEASIWYEQFRKMHPRNPQVPYALFMEGRCHYEQMLKPPRDQGETREALVSFELLLESYPESEYAEQARKLRAECRERLARHEMVVADFYYESKEFWSAAGRYQGVWRTYPDTEEAARAAFMEAECYRRLGKRNLARQAYRRVREMFPDSEFTTKAEQNLTLLDKELSHEKGF